MNNLKLILSSISSIIFSIITYLFGGIDKLFIVLIIFIVIDYITGVCKGIYTKKLSSKTGVKGIIKKFGYLLIVVVSASLDKIINSDELIRNVIIYFFIANEGISIIENWKDMNLPLPKKIIDILERLK